MSRGPTEHEQPRDQPAPPARQLFLGAEADRFAWRARIKRNPTTRRIYRVSVGVVGGLLILLAGATGWLPGPGGIPLALVGLAVLASEFEWADRLLGWVKAQVQAWARWVAGKPVWFRWLGAVLTAVVVLAAVWLYLRLLGVPTWLPGSSEVWLQQNIPGLG